MVKIDTLKQGKKIDYQGRGLGVNAPIFKTKYLTRNGHNFYVKKLTESDLPILKDYLYQTCSYADIEQGVKYETQRWLGVFNDQKQLSSLVGAYFTKDELEIVALESFNNFKNGLATYLMDIVYNWAVSYKIKTISVYKDVPETGRHFLQNQGFLLEADLLDFDSSNELFESARVGELLNSDELDDEDTLRQRDHVRRFVKRVTIK